VSHPKDDYFSLTETSHFRVPALEAIEASLAQDCVYLLLQPLSIGASAFVRMTKYKENDAGEIEIAAIDSHGCSMAGIHNVELEQFILRRTNKDNDPA